LFQISPQTSGGLVFGFPLFHESSLMKDGHALHV
jgi:hypothetical protein